MGLRRNKKLKTWFAGSQAVRVAGSRPQGPVGQVSRGLGARATRAWGPTRGLGLFPTKTTKPLKLRFFRKPPGGSLAKAWVSAETAALEVGTWRETKPGYPPYPPQRVFTLSAFGNHPKVGGFRRIMYRLENQTEKNLKNDIEAGVYEYMEVTFV